MQELAAQAWIAQAKGDRYQALSLMRAAADEEDLSEKSSVSPGRLIPARELLGDMLLGDDRAADALIEYETSLNHDPRRFRSYFGAGKAAAASRTTPTKTRSLLWPPASRWPAGATRVRKLVGLPANPRRSRHVPILETVRLEKRFGGIVATNDVSLAIDKGARHALIGPNGAGKTTVINLFTGVLRPTAGRIILDGRRHHRACPAPPRSARHGANLPDQSAISGPVAAGIHRSCDFRTAWLGQRMVADHRQQERSHGRDRRHRRALSPRRRDAPADRDSALRQAASSGNRAGICLPA